MHSLSTGRGFFVLLFVLCSAGVVCAEPSLSYSDFTELNPYYSVVYLNLVDDCEEYIVDFQPVLARVFVDGSIIENASLIFDNDRILDVNVPEGSNVTLQVYSKSQRWSNVVAIPDGLLHPPSRAVLYPSLRNASLSRVRFILSYRGENGCPVLTSSTTSILASAGVTYSSSLSMVFIVASLALIVFLVLWFSRKRGGECESGGGVPLAKDGEGNRGAGGVD
jgi:hypothetical protein